MDTTLLSLPKQDIRKLLTAKSGDAALLYLYLQAGMDPDRAMESMNMDADRYNRTMAFLRQLGLVNEKPHFLAPGDHPVYTEQDITREMEQDKQFSIFIGEVQRSLGRILSTDELKILLSMTHYLGLPHDVIVTLIGFCMGRNKNRGIARAPSMRTIEKEAYHWADAGIDTMDEAIAYIQQQDAKFGQLGPIRRSLQILDRRLTTSEERYILKWLDMGFGEPEIHLAYDRTCLNCGALKWPYMNSILVNWQSQNLFTVDQILQFDKTPERPGNVHTSPAQTGVDPMMKKAIQRRLNKKEVV